MLGSSTSDRKNIGNTTRTKTRTTRKSETSLGRLKAERDAGSSGAVSSPMVSASRAKKKRCPNRGIHLSGGWHDKSTDTQLRGMQSGSEAWWLDEGPTGNESNKRLIFSAVTGTPAKGQEANQNSFIYQYSKNVEYLQVSDPTDATTRVGACQEPPTLVRIFVRLPAYRLPSVRTHITGALHGHSMEH
jgi:hypothetical protein